MNVVHEAGLFQGRLGFERAIILLEEGCKSFSNIEGLGQIRFPKGQHCCGIRGSAACP
jgi:predicted nucleotide-binding protein